MSTILVVDDMAIFRDPIAASLKLAGYDTVRACNGQEALDAVRARRPDAILLDVAMPVMDGITMLRALRADPTTAQIPVIMLTASVEKQYVIQAAQLGVKDYLLKSRFSLAELMTRLKKYALVGAVPPKPDVRTPAAPPLVASRTQPAPTTSPASPASAAPEEIPKLLTRDDCVARAEKALSAKTLSGVVTQVISIAASPRGDLTQLASLIGRDPALSARVLQAANSASYASKRGPVTNIADAVRHIGCSTIRNIATAFGIFEAMPETGPDGFNPIRCWQHSFAVAMLCERLAQMNHPERAGTAYLIGLCHDLGEILFRTHFGKEYRQLLDVHAATGEPILKLERQMLGVSHGELLRAIVRHIGLPEEIRSAIQTFHESPDGAGDPLVRSLRLADLYANGVGLTSSPNAAIRPLSRVECRNATGAEQPAVPEAEPLRCEIYALTAMLARLTPADEQKLMAPMFPQTKAKIWLARDASFSAFDPVAAALQSMAEAVTIQPRLPSSAEEFAGHGGLFVSARTPTVVGLSSADVARAAAIEARAPALWVCAHQDDPLPAGAPGKPVPHQGPLTLRDVADFVRRASQPASVAA